MVTSPGVGGVGGVGGVSGGVVLSVFPDRQQEVPGRCRHRLGSQSMEHAAMAAFKHLPPGYWSEHLQGGKPSSSAPHVAAVEVHAREKSTVSTSA